MRSRALLLALQLFACRSAAREVTVRVTSSGAPEPAINVFFSDASGGVIAQRKTDARGEASAAAAGGSVTIATYDPELGTYELLTILETQDSDRILVELTAYRMPEVAAAVEVELPGAVDGAAGYRLLAACSGAQAKSAGTQRLDVQARCLGPDRRFTTAARADDAQGRPLAYTFDRDRRTVSATMSIALPPWRTRFVPIEVDVLNPPAKAKLQATVDPVVDGLCSLGSTIDGPFPRTVLVPAGLSDQVEVSVVAESKDRGRRAIATLVKSAPRLVVNTSELLPAIVGVRWRSTDEQRPTIEYQLDGDASGADGVWIGASFGEPKIRVNWTTLAPPSSGPIRIPALPPSLAEWSPRGPPRSAIVTIFDRSGVDGWQEARRSPTASMRHAVVRAPGDDRVRFSQGRR